MYKRQKLGIPAVTVVYTILHAGGKFGGDNSGYKVSGGLHGVGASVVNALSEWLEVEVHRDGHAYYQRFERGVPVAPLEDKGPVEGGTGTIVDVYKRQSRPHVRSQSPAAPHGRARAGAVRGGNSRRPILAGRPRPARGRT